MNTGSTNQTLPPKTTLSKRRGPLRKEDLLRRGLGDAVGEREGQVLGDQLLDVWSLDVLTLLELDDAEDLVRKG